MTVSVDRQAASDPRPRPQSARCDATTRPKKDLVFTCPRLGARTVIGRNSPDRAAALPSLAHSSADSSVPPDRLPVGCRNREQVVPVEQHRLSVAGQAFQGRKLRSI